MLQESHCVKCGKPFFKAPQHVYKDHKGVYCSWSCFNHRKEKKNRPSKCVEQYSKSGRLVCTFPSAAAAAEHISGTADNIRTACRECSFYKGYLWRYKE